MEKISKICNKDKNLTRLLIVFIFAFALFSLTQGSQFLKINTFQTMGKLFPEYGLLALGMSLALFTGGIDLSVVFVANLSSIIIAKMLSGLITNDAPIEQALPVILLSFLVAILVGIMCGAINGFLISSIGIPPILATLGTQSLVWGISVVITGGSTMSGFPSQMSQMMIKSIFGIPVSTYIFIIIATILGFVVSRTTLGYKLRMLGTNARATTFSGLSNLKLTMTTYMMIGALSAVSGIIMTGRMNSAKANNGSSYTMQAILIAVLGGIDPKGGKGNIRGVVVAIVIVQMVSTWLSMFEDISSFYRQIIWGGLLLFVLIFNHVINNHDKKKAMKA